MSERANYSRIYWPVVDDPKFVDVYDNDPAWALWTRLLMAADQAWPASANVPLTCKRSALDRLVHNGIVDLQPGGRFRLHGLDAERERRKAAATRSPTGPQLGGKREAVAPRTPPLDETRRDKDETSNPRGTFDAHTRDGLIHVTPLVAEAWVDACGITLRASGVKAQDVIDDICRRHPESKVLAAIHTARDAFPHIPEVNSLAYATRNILDPFLDTKAAQRATAEQREADAGRRRVQATHKRNHDTGWHTAEPNPMCDACTGRAA